MGEVARRSRDGEGIYISLVTFNIIVQGDVIAIMNGSGTIVVEYTYDAWGYIRATSGDLANTLGKANALRYRGYVYDRETGLYYLQSRYYNPGTGRFINADALVSTGQGLLGNNMFAYCLNNPIILSDPSGTIPFYDDPLQKAIEEFCDWFHETDEEERDENGKRTVPARVKKTLISMVMNMEAYGGLGVGFGEKLKILNAGEELLILLQYGIVTDNGRLDRVFPGLYQSQ